MTKKMICINNFDYEHCMTIGKVYDVTIQELGQEKSMKSFIDDNGVPLRTMIDRFKEVD